MDRAAWYKAFQPPPAKLKQTENKGIGLEASQQINKDEIIFTEVPIAAFTTSTLQHCHHCCKSLASWPEDVELPLVNELWPDKALVPCECGFVGFCSPACRKAAHELYHAVCCPARCDDQERRDHLVALIRACGPDSCSMSSVEGKGEVGALEEFPGLVVKIVSSILETARRGQRKSPGSCIKKELDDAYHDLLAHAVAAPHSVLPDVDYEHFTSTLHKALGMGQDECCWLESKKTMTIFAILCANATRVRQISQFELYMRNLRNQVRRERRLALLHKVQSACAQVAGMEMIPANKIDEIMKGIFGASDEADWTRIDRQIRFSQLACFVCRARSTMTVTPTATLSAPSPAPISMLSPRGRSPGGRS